MKGYPPNAFSLPIWQSYDQSIVNFGIHALRKVIYLSSFPVCGENTHVPPMQLDFSKTVGVARLAVLKLKFRVVLWWFSVLYLYIICLAARGQQPFTYDYPISVHNKPGRTDASILCTYDDYPVPVHNMSGRTETYTYDYPAPVHNVSGGTETNSPYTYNYPVLEYMSSHTETSSPKYPLNILYLFIIICLATQRPAAPAPMNILYLYIMCLAVQRPTAPAHMTTLYLYIICLAAQRPAAPAPITATCIVILKLFLFHNSKNNFTHK